MRPLNKEQIRSPKRDTESITLSEYSAPLLLAKPSALFAVGLRARKADFGSAENIAAMLSDMLVDENGDRLLIAEDVTIFLSGISAESLAGLVSKCTEMLAGKGDAPVPSEPSPSA